LDIFGYLSGASLSREHVSDFIEQAYPYHQIVVLTSTKRHPIVTSGTRVEKEYLIPLARAARHVAIGAYDGDGVLIWTRPDR
jgi:hypothetical protein